MKFILSLLALIICTSYLSAQVRLSGTVSEEGTGLPLPGANVRLKLSGQSTVTDQNGRFSLPAGAERDSLLVSYVGFNPASVPVQSPYRNTYTIFLTLGSNSIQAVVVSTGYQKISRERSTGSFEQIGTPLFNREVSTDVLSRLEGIASGVLFDKRNGNANDFSIRGLSTLTSTISQPLIVVDNFPYDGNINNINPNDVESVTLLKDAAASSIWGVRAGNGVVVITTKKGKLNQPLKIGLNSNVTISAKPNLYAYPTISSSDFIDVEKMLFAKGFYDDDLTNTYAYPVVSPVVSLLSQVRRGTLSATQANSQIDALRSLDVRKDFDQYVYRQTINQQYQLNISGGSENAGFIVSAGYDKNLQNLVGNQYDRLTFRNANDFRPVKNLQVQTTIQYTQSNTVTNSSGGYGTLFSGSGKTALLPYAQLADADGNPLPVLKDYAASFVDTAGNGRLLDWKYRPLAETRLANNTSRLHDLLLNAAATYKFLPSLSAELRYQYENAYQNGSNDYAQDSYYTRNQINLYSQISGNTLTRVIPLGDILDQGKNTLVTHDVRGQLNYNHDWGSRHSLSAIAGGEINQVSTNASTLRTYGYNPNTLTSQGTDLLHSYTTYNGIQGSNFVPYVNAFSGLLNRKVSAYANAAYTYLGRYTLSGSARRDASNLFGVETNNKWVPLWSAGAGWTLSKESFYRSAWLPYLKLRATYGYSGNVNNTIPAVTTIAHQNPNSLTSVNGLPFARITNFPNPNLTWEKVGILNLGLDFATRDNRITGSVEYYAKRATNLLGLIQADLTAGAGATLNYNSANLRNSGIDLTLNSANFKGAFSWNTALLFSVSRNRVTRYLFTPSSYSYYVYNGGIISPVVGQPAYNLVSYRWAGLNPQDGNPRAYLNGQVSEDYAAITSRATEADLVFSGSALPVTFGSLRNDFAWHSLSLSFNLVYRFGYYFRRNSVNYSLLYSTWSGGYGDFAQRWQKPGDEQFTQVPAMNYPADGNRDQVYNYSSATVEKGDNIRLQDVRLAYTLGRNVIHRLPVKSIQLFAYINNAGILWRANKLKLDPDFGGLIPLPRTYSFGCNIDF